MNILLLLRYVVLLSVYAYAFGSYAADFLPESGRDLWRHVMISGVLIGLVALNVVATRLVLRSENFFNAVKMILLAGFVTAGLAVPMDWSRLAPGQGVTSMGLIAGAMLIFLNYEGFELIANASNEVANPKRSLPIAYVGGVLITIILYVLIVTVVLGHLDFAEVTAARDTALSAAGSAIMGKTGQIVIAVAALCATSSAINATFYSTGRLAYIVAKTGELPRELERTICGQHSEGALITAAMALVIANFVPLEAIATMGSAGFLLIFMAVNIANVRLARQTGSRAWLSLLAALATSFALVVLCVKVEENPATRNHLWILAGMIGSALAIEIGYRSLTGRRIRLSRSVS
jgi:amino acid transporter